MYIKPINIPLLILSFCLFLGFPFSCGVCDGRRQALWCVSQAEALGGVTQVEVTDVEDVFQGGGVCRIRPHKRLQGWRSDKKFKYVRADGINECKYNLK